MHSIESEDGTPIRYFRRGHGPAILLIHGTAADHSRWAPVVPALQRHFTVCAMDRRGRGGRGGLVHGRRGLARKTQTPDGGSAVQPRTLAGSRRHPVSS